MAYVSEMGRFLNYRRPMSTAILRYPSGRFGIVGSIPYELTKPAKAPSTGRNSLAWDTEEEAIAALLALGITHFQRADCSWYDAPAS